MLKYVLPAILLLSGSLTGHAGMFRIAASASACAQGDPKRLSTLEIKTASPNFFDLTTPTILFRAGPRQTISGYGAGAGEDNGPGQNFGSLSEARKARLAKAIFTDTHIDTLRVWASLDHIAKKPGQVDISRFVRGYIDSGLIKHARAAGVKRLLCARRRARADDDQGNVARRRGATPAERRGGRA